MRYGIARPTASARVATTRLIVILAILLEATVHIASTASPARAATPSLPPGFFLQDMPSGQTSQLTSFASGPDNSWFTTGKQGRVAWVAADGSATILAQLNVDTRQDLGLLNIALAVDYATTHRIYTVRVLTVGSTTSMRLESWIVTGGSTPSGLLSDQVILDVPTTVVNHTMDRVLPAADGTLWVSIGDSASFTVVDPLALRALDTNQPYGKLLHIRADGSGVPTNPFYDTAAPSSWRSRVYASGFRNPWRFTLDPSSGVPVVGDVGWSTTEEIDIVQPGTSYGWPCWEGPAQTQGYKDLAACTGVSNAAPLFSYPHGPLGTAVMGGVGYTGTSYPAAYQGAYFFGDLAAKRLYTLVYDGQGKLTRSPEPGGFGTGIGAVVSLGTAPNGDIVYADIGSSKIRRLEYTAGNTPPSVKATVTNDPATLDVTFDASATTDHDGDALSFLWNFGDGSTGLGAKTTHRYAAPGTSPVTATLSVDDGATPTVTQSFTVVPANHTPVVTITGPPPGTTFAVGDPVTLSATALDVEDGALPVHWDTTLVHCSGPFCHDHPGFVTDGPTYSQPFTDHGDNTRLNISASATDSAGAIGTATYTASPKQHVLNVAANTPAAISINGVARMTSQQTVNAQETVDAPTTATNGVATFDHWSNSQPRTQSFVMPNADVNLTATYLTPIDRRLASDAAFSTLLGAPLGPEVGDASLRFRDFQNGRAYWTSASSVHEVHGDIKVDYLAAGGSVMFGEPTTDETSLPDGMGRFSDFRLQASSYWTPRTGAHLVYGLIRADWRTLGAQHGPLGYPLTDERNSISGRGRVNNFQFGGIYWLRGTPAAKSVHGAIYTKYTQLGQDNGLLGFPLTDEAATSNGNGRFNLFEHGSIYWSPSTGPHEVHGAIRDRWIRLGANTSYLGLPISDEFSIPGGRRSNFVKGFITWSSTTGMVVDRRY